MAKLIMKKIQLIGMIQDSKEIIDDIQRRGTIEVENVEQSDAIIKVDTNVTQSQFDRFFNTAHSALDILNGYAPAKKSLLASFSGRKEMGLTNYLKKSEQCDKILVSCDEIIRCEKDITQAKADIIKYYNQLDALAPWLNLDIGEKFSGTQRTAVFIGSFPDGYDEASLRLNLAQIIPEVDKIETEIVSAEQDQTCAVIVCMREDAKDVENALRSLSFVRPADPTKHPPKQRMKRFQDEIKRLEALIENLKEKIKSYQEMYSDIEFVSDYFLIRKEKYEVLNKLAMSQYVFDLEGYIPEKYADKLVKDLAEKYLVAISVSDVSADEDVPVAVENNQFVSGVESITTMYSTPNKNDIDPNPIMAFFYYAFFGLMLSDAGYGLVMVIAMLFAKFKLKLEDNAKKAVNMFFYCGISTMFWGAMFGSWFGDLIPTVYTQLLDKPAPRIYIWLEPVNDPMKLMLYCFLFGIIHLFVGLGARFYELCKDGKVFDAVCDVGFVYLFVIGIAPIGASVLTNMPQIILTISKYLLIIGALGIVLTSGRSSKNIFGKLGSGIYGLYNISSGYLGDILSYSRLLALGLSTGVIASVVNMLGTMPENKVAKTIMLVVVGIVGHTVNIAINLIGSYVHTSRLQYVEFFSKFYEGGGRSFTPFKINTKYFKFKEETNNG